MTTVEINILDDEDLILNVLRAFEKKHLLTFINKESLALFGRQTTELEYESMLNEARKTPAYTLEEAKSYLNL